MLKNRRKVIIFAVLIAISGSFMAAASKKPKTKISAPKKDEVMFVGRVTVHNSQDLDFFAKARGVLDEVMEREDVYYLPYVPTKKQVDAYDIGVFESQSNFKNGEIFLANYEKTKTMNFCFTFPFQYFFHGDTNLLIYLPSDFMVTVPEGEKYVYIGDFDFYVEGKDFAVVKVTHTDNFDVANDEVKRLFGEKAVLSRAPLLPVDTEDESYVESLTVVTYY